MRFEPSFLPASRATALCVVLSGLLSGTAMAVDAGGSVDVRTLYSDNLFHLSEFQLRTFDLRTGPGQRFEGMESPEDIVTRLRDAGHHDPKDMMAGITEARKK